MCNGDDDDCDGATDEDYVADSSCFLPGVCAAGNTASTCIAGTETGCATGSPSGIAESVCNGDDDDCDSATDEDYVADSSCFLPGVCAAGNAASTCIAGAETVCATGSPSGIAESVCNGDDDDCDGAADEDYVTDTSCFLPGVCAAGNAASTCIAGAETACATGSPAASDETDSALNCNGLDDDCDGEIDEDAAVRMFYYLDSDNDSYGADDNATRVLSCAAPAGYVDNSTGFDCNDTNPAVNPGADEVCNGIDDDCDGAIDEGFPRTIYYRDADNDTYGNADNSTVACEAPAGYVDNSTGFDCNDNNSAVNPGAEELCGNGIDDDCDGVIDDNCTAECIDEDNDGYFVGEGCTPFDCDDTDWKTHEGCEAAPCSLTIIPKQIFKAAAFFVPVGPYIISADKESGIDFGTFKVRFASDAIRTINGVRIGKRIIIGFYTINPFKLAQGETTAEVEIYGRNPEFWCAPFTVR
jgi:hypothetical protein